VEKEDKGNENSSKGNDNFFDFDFLTKFLKPLKTLFDLQFRILKLEFKRESGRFVEGVLSLVSGCFFLAIFWLLLNVLLIAGLYDFLNLRLFYSILIDCGVNLLFSVLFFMAGKSKLKKEFFKDTRKILEETIDDLK